MFYEERCIDGVWYWRGAPDGEWNEFTVSDLRTKLAAETKRAEAAEAQRDKLAELLHNLKLDREDHDGDCATGTWSVAAEEVLDAALAEMEKHDANDD